MTLHLNAKSLPRYQAIGMVAIVLFLIVTISTYFLVKVKRDNEQRLQLLHDEIYQQQREQLVKEVQAAQDYIQFMISQAEAVLMDESRSQVEQAYAVANSIYNQQKNNLSDHEIQILIRESLRDVRFFNGRGYLFIDDMNGICILLPTAPQLEGKSLYDNQDDTGHYIMRGLIQAASSPSKSGFSRYRWYPPGNTTDMAGKIAYVKQFEPFNWLIGAGDYIYRIENDLKNEALKRLSSIRFGKNGYIAVLHKDGKVLNSPSQPNPINVNEIISSTERKLVNRLIDFAATGGGFIGYEWFTPGGKTAEAKLSYVKSVEPLGWILVAGIYPKEIELLVEHQRERVKQSADEDFLLLLSVLSATALITLLMALTFSRWFSHIFNRYQNSIDQQRLELEENAQQLQIAARVFDTASEGIIVTDPNNKIVAVNDALQEITGYTQQELIGKNPSILASEHHDKLFYHQMWQELQKTDQWRGEVWNRRKDGQIYPEWLAISISRDADGNITNYIATVTDISDQKDAEQRLRYLAEFDPLTELPNRRLLHERVTQALAICEHNQQQQCALMFIDLDRFKTINDSLGHSAGDHILKVIARRLQKVVDEADTVSRLGGDEFVILINDANAEASAARLAARIQQQSSLPIDYEQQQLITTPSIGIAVYPEDGRDFDTLLRNADTALYHAKGLGRNNFQFYTADMNIRASEKLILEHDLRTAIKEQQFELYYQPQFDITTQELCGCEALIRWQHPEKGLISPANFIPLAEETGLITLIGDWVLNEACQQARSWQLQGYTPIKMAVNVASLQFERDIFRSVNLALNTSELQGCWLTLEITESTLMNNPNKSVQEMNRLKDLAIEIALDDFGTGYSSLAYLKRFPINKLKIDRAFIDGLPNDPDDVAITRSIISVAQNLNLTTLAEGVETAEQLQFLQTAGCKQLQGYLKAKPMPASEIEQILPLKLADING